MADQEKYYVLEEVRDGVFRFLHTDYFSNYKLCGEFVKATTSGNKKCVVASVEGFERINDREAVFSEMYSKC